MSRRFKPPRFPAMPKLHHFRSRPVKLVAANEFVSGEAFWERVDGLWRCARASVGLEFILKLEPGAAKLELARRGFSWKWKR